MENASKALLMAGGILVALMVIGALLLMINQVGNYQRSEDVNKKDKQIAEFNLDFERYADDKGIKGTDIMSLTNKIVDYNNKALKGGVSNSVDYSIKMSITVTGLNSFNFKYANGSSAIFTNDTYTTNELKNKFTSFTNSTSNDELKRQISEFKSSKFEAYRSPEYENGQIKNFYFKFIE